MCAWAVLPFSSAQKDHPAILDVFLWVKFMPREVKAFACEHSCGRKVLISKKRMVEHEAICFLNPERRACQTCANFETYKDSDDSGQKWIVNFCHAEELAIERVSDCDLWEPKQHG